LTSARPPLSMSTASASPALDALIRACLAKDPDERIQTAHDIKLQLTWLTQTGGHSGTTGPIELPKRHQSHETIAWVAAAVALLAAAFFAFRGGLGGGDGAPRQQLLYTIPIPRSLTPIGQPRISPDGRTLAYAAQDSLNRTMIW